MTSFGAFDYPVATGMRFCPLGFLLPTVDRALVHAGGLWGGHGRFRVLRRERGQGQRFAVGVPFASGSDASIREHTIAALVHLDASATVGVQAVQLGDDGLATFVQTALDVVDGVTADVPGASDGFRDDGAIGLLVGTAPQLVGDAGLAGAAAEEVVALLKQRQIVDALAVVDATNGLSFGAGAVAFAVEESVGTVEHRAHIVRFAVQLAFRRRRHRWRVFLGDDGAQDAHGNEHNRALGGHFLSLFFVIRQ